MSDDIELTAARQRVAAYRLCGHPLIPTAVWLLGKVERQIKEIAQLSEDLDEYKKIAKGLMGIDWCVGYELSADQLVELDNIRCKCFDIVERELDR